MTGIHGLEPMTPEEGVQTYISRRASEISQSTKYEHTTRLNRFLEWCDQVELDNLNDLNSRKCGKYLEHRQSEIAPTTLENEMRTFRLAVEEWEAVDAVVDGLSKKVKVPTARKAEKANKIKIDPQHAHEIEKYLAKYEYASFGHVLFTLFWKTGARCGGIRALDLKDFYPEKYKRPVIEFKHRPETGTPLKNDRWGEREVPVSKETGELLQDYINDTRHDSRDEHGRKPLLTTKQGRPQKTTIQRNIYGMTRPCYIGMDCPEEKDPDECEWTSYNQSSKCPNSVSPHAVRAGFVTRMRNKGADFDTIGDRVDATAEVLRLHYDTPTPQEKRDRQMEWADKL
ncbi:site-specific integrase [Haloterrigena sp. SYSU A558-1]|uniref:Site-specific integrase n=1 Tax=Haloterrigena gelatinilytica TaxID=2741724 RepID=A0ABX2LFZ9_9EURY|nr:site-specific integrase [Haloterrigena gelatinilytica]NUC72527.1 site-specific integrase [Haloterrigena gelatinilytica]